MPTLTALQVMTMSNSDALRGWVGDLFEARVDEEISAMLAGGEPKALDERRGSL